jgi:hypothetical protein
MVKVYSAKVDELVSDTLEKVKEQQGFSNFREVLEFLLNQHVNGVSYSEPQIIEKEIEVIKEIPIKLEPNQAVVSFTDKNLDLIRAGRVFLKLNGLLEATNVNDVFNEVMNAAIPVFMNETIGLRND